MVAAARSRALAGRTVLPAPPALLVGPGFLLVAIVFLTGFRVALNVTDGNVIDVGYASVIGADLLSGGHPVYGGFPLDNEHGDTYGPVAYAAYVPFEALWPWSGTWDDLPAAHAAALTFDLGSAALLWLIGRRLRDQALGLLLAYLWLAFPFSLLVANSGANDALVALLVLAALLVAGRVARGAAGGALIGLAGLTKFAPLGWLRCSRPTARAASARWSSRRSPSPAWCSWRSRRSTWAPSGTAPSASSRTAIPPSRSGTSCPTRPRRWLSSPR
jgi:hypothetical protein